MYQPRQRHFIMAPPKRPKIPARRSRGTFVSPVWLTVLAIVLLAVATYWSSFRNRFVWHDVTTIAASASDGRWICPRPPQYSGLIRYVFSLEHQLWGLTPKGYHLISLAGHAVSALLIWRLLTLLALPGARLAALIFAVHPVCVESVAWVGATDTNLSLTLCLASLLAYWRSAEHPPGDDKSSFARRTGLLYGLALVLYVAALFCSPLSIALPAVLVALQWWQYGRLTLSRLSRIAPFAGLALLAIAAGATPITFDHQTLGSPGQLLATSAIVAGRSVWFYAGKLIWPDPLIFIYPRWEIDPSLWWQYMPLVAALSVMIGLWWLRARIGRGPAAATMAFGILLLPHFVFGAERSLCDTFVADHFQYHALVALIALFAAAFVLTVRRLAPNATAALVVASIFILAPLVFLTERRTHVFYDRRTLDQETVARNPTAWMAHHDLAVVLQEEGLLDQAMQAERRAIEILNERRQAISANGDCADDLAGCHEHLAVLLEQAGRPADATVERDKSLAIREELVRQWPEVPNYHDHLAWSYVDLAVSSRARGNVVEAVEWYRKAATEQQIVIATAPARFETEANLAANYVDIGLLELDQGRAAEATAAFTSARDLRERLVERFPREPKYLDGLAWCYTDLALVETWLVHRESALRLLSQAVILREQLVHEFPAVAEYREQLAILYSDVGLKERQLENLAAAERAFRSALELRQCLADEDPQVNEYQDRLAANLVDIGSVQRARGDLAAAEESYREAIRIRARLALVPPTSSPYRQRLAGTYVELGIVLREAGRADASLASCRQAIDICRQLLHDAPQELAHQVALSWAYENLGLAQIAAGQNNEAVTSCESALRLTEECVQQSGGEIGSRVDLGRAYCNLATAQAANGQFAEAEANYRLALEVRAQVIQDGPAVDLYKHNAAESCRALADLLRATGRRQGAAALYRAAIDIHESLVAQNRSTTYLSSLRDDLLAFADVSAELGDWSASAAAYAKACRYAACTTDILARLALVQLAAGDEASYRETCVELLRKCNDSASPPRSLPVALALVVGKHEKEHAATVLSLAQRAAGEPVQPEASVLIAAAKYRAGMVDDAAAEMSEALQTVPHDQDRQDRSLILRLIGTMLLADVYRDQNKTMALDEELAQLDDLIFETIVSAGTVHDDTQPAWLVRFCVEIARRKLVTLRPAASDNPAARAAQ